jgi:hypothetical protein
MIIECQLLSIIDEDCNMQYVSLAESFLTVNKKFLEKKHTAVYDLVMGIAGSDPEK